MKSLPKREILRQIFYLAKLFDLEGNLFKKIKLLSGGNKRKASLLAALLGAPSLLIIDEPTRNLDPAVGREVLLAPHFLAFKTGRTFLFTCKKPAEVLLIADSVINLTPIGEGSEITVSDH